MVVDHSLRCLNIGFVSTRFAGTDGVSLEAEKWAYVLETMGHKCFYFAGELDRPAEVSMVVPEAFFHHPEIAAINERAFSQRTRPKELTRCIHEMRVYFKEKLYEFTARFDLELLIVENALAIPINIPLGLALSEFIIETGFPTIGHHHDMFWERKRFLVNCVWDYCNMAFPPHIPYIRHVVINSSASNQLSLRTGISSELVPNVMDFDHPPPPPDDYASDVREALGIKPHEKFILQPTRIVQRKGIEHAIDLVRRLDVDAKLVISHASGDEGYEYEQFIRNYAQRIDVPTLFVSDIIKDVRGTTEDGRKVYCLKDVYPFADLVTYPSDIEGFGNAFLEAVYFRRPIVVNNYSIYAFDIKPKGFKVVEFDGFITKDTVRQSRRLLTDPDYVTKMVEHNYQLAKKHYSYSILRRHLEVLNSEFFGEYANNNNPND